MRNGHFDDDDDDDDDDGDHIQESTYRPCRRIPLVLYVLLDAHR